MLHLRCLKFLKSKGKNSNSEAKNGVNTIAMMCMHAQSLSRVQFCATPWTVAHQAPLSVGLSWQENWGGLPFSPPGDLPDPGNKPTSPVASALQADSVAAEPAGKPHSYDSDQHIVSHFFQGRKF